MMVLSRCLVNLDDLGPQRVIDILDRAAYFESSDYRGTQFAQRNVCLCFFQPSTRTRVGFAAATGRLGGIPIMIDCVKHQQDMFAAESVEDTIRVIACYSDVLVMRHKSVDKVRRAASIARIPFVNGGSGHVFHPTQALIDLYAIRRHVGRLHTLRIGIAGDIATSRTGHSLLRALSWFTPAELRLMHPPSRGPSDDVLQRLPANVVTAGIELDPADLDVLYMAGSPPGEGESRLDEAVRSRFVLTEACMERLPKSGVVLCALPRTGDIRSSVDSDPRAMYFAQSAAGLFVRMAILEHMVTA